MTHRLPIYVLFLVSSLAAQNDPPYPYLLHLETMDFDNQVCILLQADGKFHLEQQHGDRTKVFEGTLSNIKRIEIQVLINNDGLRMLKQKQIVMPQGAILLDELHIDIFRGDHWQDLFFPDDSSRKPFAHSITPLLRWLEDLHKEPYRERGEDEAKNNCQLPKRIVLKPRSAASENPTARP